MRGRGYEIAVGMNFKFEDLTYFYIGFGEWKIDYPDGSSVYGIPKRKIIKELIAIKSDCEYFTYYWYEDNRETLSVRTKIRLNTMIELNEGRYSKDHQKFDIKNVDSQFIEDEKDILRYWGWKI